MSAVSPPAQDGDAPREGGRPATGVAGVLAMALVVLLVVAVGWASPWAAALDQQGAQVESDFQILHAAGRGLVEGRDIHDPAVLDEIGRRDGRPATPFCAANPLVVRTYGLLASRELSAAYRIGLWVNVALAVLAVLGLARVVRLLAGERGDSPWLALAIGLAALGLGEGLWMSLAMNSTNLLALAALVAALLAACGDRPGLEGGCLAVAVVAKTSPALMLLVVLLAGRWRVAAWGVGVTIVLGALSIAWSGWGIHESWLTRVLPALGYAPEVAAGNFNNSLHAWNLSPNGLLSRAMLQADAPRFFALLGAWAVTALVLVQLWSGLRGSDGRGAAARSVTARVREYALGSTAILLVSSVTWPHHLVFLAIPTVWLIWRLRLVLDGHGTLVGTLVGVACVALLCVPLGTLDASPDLALGVPLRTAALVVLFAVLAPRAADGQAAAPTGSRAGGVARP